MSHSHGIEQNYNDEELNGNVKSSDLPIPMGWKILIQPNQTKSKTKGGIILPSKAKESEAYLTAHGEVLAIGELAYRDRNTGERWRMNTKPQVGDKVTLLSKPGYYIVSVAV